MNNFKSSVTVPSSLLFSSLLLLACALPAPLPAQTAASGPNIAQLEAEAAGNADKGFLAGLAYYDGIYGAKVDFAKARKWFTLSAGKGDTRSYTYLGNMSVRGLGVKASWQEAAQWYRKGAEKNDPDCLEKMGDISYEGLLGKQDFAAAAAWYKKGAAAGSGPSASRLGRMMMMGEGVPVDYPGALKYLLSAGSYKDNVFIAEIYRSGVGVPRDLTKSAEYLLQGANAGDTGCMQKLGEAYADGNAGLPQNNLEAYKWLSVVIAREKNDVAEKLRDEVYARMGVTEKAQAKLRTADFVSKHK